MQQGPVYRTKSKKKKNKRARLTSILVVLVLVVVLFVVALLVAGKGVAGQAPSAPSALPQSVASSSEPVSSVSQPEVLQPPAATGPYDVEGLPPLYNYQNPIPEGTAPDLVDVGYGQQMDRAAAAAFLAMQEAAAAEGIELTPVSGFRSHETQTNNYNASIQRYLAQGIDEAEATRLTERYYAIPGTSEHEAGLAMDINLVEDSFADTPAFAWLQQHANEYGFLFRYRAEAEEITHIAYEPWHYRYVGANHAAEIEKRGITLEEYMEVYTAQP